MNVGSALTAAVIRTSAFVAMVCLGLAANAPAQTTTVEYIHTDALGSPVATTDALGALVSRQSYEPYGSTLLSGPADGPGFTGHVADSATGLNYMQQRYYDSQVGAFLSVDPITADRNSGGNFNRYKYAANNPYKFTDPDGRQEAADRFGDQFKKDAESGNAEVYAPLRGPAVVITAAMAAPVVAVVGEAALANPVTATNIINTTVEGMAGDVLGGATLVASSATAGLGLAKQLASEAQTARVLAREGEAIAGAGTGAALRDAPRLAAQHGGEAGDWAKVSGGNFVAKDGAMVETHAYQNVKTGQVVEPKTKLQNEGQ